MKIWKRIASLVLALTLVAALGMTALADNEAATTPAYSITVTNTNDNVSISGKTYSAYKLFDVSYNKGNESYVYSVADAFKDFTYTVGETTYSGDALIAYLGTQKDDSDALNAFAEAALKHVTEKKISASGSVTIAADAETGTINLNEPGYYLVAGTASDKPGATEEITAACSLDTTNPTMTVNPKVDAPHVEKKIVDGEKRLSETSANVGDVISYEVMANIPDMTGYESYTFTFKDTMSKGLTFNNNVAITLEFADKTTKTLTKDTDFTVDTKDNADGTTTITIDLKNFIDYKGKGGTVKVTYSATVNEKADLSETGNPNEVTLTFSNNPNNSGAGGSTATTPESKTIVYVTGLKLIKTDDKKANPVKLAGAKFQISGVSEKIVIINNVIYEQDANGTLARLKSDGSYVTYDEADKALYDTDANGAVLRFKKIETVTQETEKTNINTIGYTDANGVLTFAGLGAGRYTIEERKAPDGYNLLKTPIIIEIKWEKESETSEKMVLKAYEVQNNTDGTEKLVPLNKDNETHLWYFTVVNKSGTQLPSTGGVGTTMFYVIGSLLVVGAVVLLITKKRLSREN